MYTTGQRDEVDRLFYRGKPGRARENFEKER